MERFDITIKNDKIKVYKFISLLLVLLNVIVFIFLLIAGVNSYKVAVALLFSGLYIIYLLYSAKKSRNVFFINEVTFFILAAGWVVLQNYLAAFALVLLGILYYLSLQKIHVVFTGRFIKKINFPQKTYSWEVVENVLLRDNILTIDLKNNTLIQVEIESDVDEIQFNEFTRQYLYHRGFTGKTIVE